MADLQSKSKSEVVAALQRAKSTIQNANKKTKEVAGRTVNTGLTVAAGYGVGMMRKKFGEGPENKVLIPGTEVEADLVLGVGLSLAGVAGLGDDKADSVAALGAGALAGYLAINAIQAE